MSTTQFFPERTGRVPRSFIDTVQRLDPIDTLILQKLYDASDDPRSPNALQFLAEYFKVSSREIEVSILNLSDLKCVYLPTVNETANFVLTSYGYELMRACSA
jgi:hypothetical protein